MIYGKVNQKRMEKVKKLNLKWYALIHHYDQEKLDPYNVLYEDMVYHIDEVIDKTGDYEQIKEKVRIELMSMFWSRTEFEWIASQWTGKEFEDKIDLWRQCYANLDLITEYLIFKLAPKRYHKIVPTRRNFEPNTYL